MMEHAPQGMPDAPIKEKEEMREFMTVVRQALLHIVAYIERRYGLKR